MVLVIWVCILASLLALMLAMAYFVPITSRSYPLKEKQEEIEGQMPLWVEEALDEMPFDDDEKP